MQLDCHVSLHIVLELFMTGVCDASPYVAVSARLEGYSHAYFIRQHITETRFSGIFNFVR